MSERRLIAHLADLPPGTGKAVEVGGRRIAIFNVSGRLYAVDDACSHDQASLAEGEVQGTTVTCPWHGAEFDLTCGKALSPPAVENLKTYPVFVNGDSIELEL